MQLFVDEHPVLSPAAFVTRFPTRVEDVPCAALAELLTLEAPAPLQREEEVRKAVRDLLRHGGYKPTGRGKPASEYLVRSASDGKLGSINAPVDACNAVSLASGLPISVIDLDRAHQPFRLGLAAPETTYVFNASGQTIDVSGLLCLFDSDGPVANAVKDSQRTKTHAETLSTLSVIWSAKGLEEQLGVAVTWYRRLLEEAGATTAAVELRTESEAR